MGSLYDLMHLRFWAGHNYGPDTQPPPGALAKVLRNKTVKKSQRLRTDIYISAQIYIFISARCAGGGESGVTRAWLHYNIELHRRAPNALTVRRFHTMSPQRAYLFSYLGWNLPIFKQNNIPNEHEFA
jgi:hypothetical protein